MNDRDKYILGTILAMDEQKGQENTEKKEMLENKIEETPKSLYYKVTGFIPENSKTKELKHIDICKELTSIYVKKNLAYGDAFLKVRKEVGQSSVVVRLLDKIFRFKTLVENKNISEDSESIVDTLKDLANYCIMEIMAIESDMGKSKQGLIDSKNCKDGLAESPKEGSE